MSNRWDYKIVHVVADKATATGLPDDLNVEFDRIGLEGWELVATETVIRPSLGLSGSTTVGLVAFFKRPAVR